MKRTVSAPQDAGFAIASEALIAEVKRALAHAEQAAAANEQRSQEDAPPHGDALVGATWEAAFVRIREQLLRFGDRLDLVEAEAGEVENLLHTEEETVTAWRREARQVAESLARRTGPAL